MNDETAANEAFPLHSEESASIADGVPRKLDPRSIAVDLISGWISTAVFSGGALLAFLFLVAAGWFLEWFLVLLGMLWLVFTSLLVWLTPRLPCWTYKHTSYIVRPDGIEIRRGILWKSVVNVPRSRVQHTDVSQGPLLRRFGLANLTMYTAGTHNASVELGGLAHETALEIRDFLIHRDETDAA